MPVKDIGDFWEWYALALENRWTDGLVVAPPVESRVVGILDYLERAPDEVLGVVGPRGASRPWSRWRSSTARWRVVSQSTSRSCSPRRVYRVLELTHLVVGPVSGMYPATGGGDWATFGWTGHRFGFVEHRSLMRAENTQRGEGIRYLDPSEDPGKWKWNETARASS